MSEKKKRMENMDRSKIGKMTPKEKLSLIPFAPPEDPIYKVGYIIGEIKSPDSIAMIEAQCQQGVDRLLKENADREKKRQSMPSLKRVK